MKGSNFDQDKVIHTYIRAIEINPKRSEAYYGLVSYCRHQGLNNLGYIFGKQSIDLQAPSGALFVEKYIYDYALLDEYDSPTFNLNWKFAHTNSLKCNHWNRWMLENSCLKMQAPHFPQASTRILISFPLDL
jgi:hypothetical protein